MKTPRKEQWERIEQLAEEIKKLSPEQAAIRFAELSAGGESPTVITLLGAWLELLPPPTTLLREGTVLGGRYVLRSQLGEGGMGSVWQAEQRLIDREVAIKIIHPSLVTPDLTSRFIGEMKVLGQLSHPGIVRIYDAGLHQDPVIGSLPFFAMEWIDGQRLDRWAESRRGDYSALLRAASRICAALASAHERHIVHRDLKPSNILVRSHDQPVLVDFGIARLRGIIMGQEEGHFSGTPHYAAPEQHLGRDHNFRSGESVDVYATGAILFEMFSGRRLHEFAPGTSLEEMRRTVLTSQPPRLSEIVKGIPNSIDELIARAVRREPSDRFYSIVSFWRAVERCLKEISQPESLSSPWRPARRQVIPGTHWKLTEKIGEGGAGEVWIGMHDKLGEKRVFKFCDTEEKARTLKREMTLFRLLKERVGQNPHFIPLHDVSLDEPPWYIMMDYVDARDLDTWCRSRPGGLKEMPESLRLEIVAQAAEALQAAHEAGILHRDIKPANLLISETRSQDGGIQVLVADFGIGQLAAEELLRDGTRLGFTRTVSELRGGPLSGSMLYLAPELLEGNPATARSDIYSLGVVLWQFLAGNLSAALDPVDWPSAVPDPILRDILHRCLAGSPARRWASAGEFAASLRDLPRRRTEQEFRRQEMAARERAAYRHGLWRAALVSGVIMTVVIALALLAWRQRRQALQARGDMALEQAAALTRSGAPAGRRKEGLRLLETAALTATNGSALRTAAASVMGLTDLMSIAPDTETVMGTIRSPLPMQSGEVCRAMSRDGTRTAVARDLDGLNGVIDIFDSSTGQKRLTIARIDFPWIPVAEPELLAFSEDGRLIAVGGADTSRHVLIFDTESGSLKAYLYHESDPQSLVWHPASRLLVTGAADAVVRIWDVNAARPPDVNATTGSDFDLPPRLNEPAVDMPALSLKGLHGPVKHLVFSPNGYWLHTLDVEGNLRIYSGLRPLTDGRPEEKTDLEAAPVTASVETRLENAGEIAALHAGEDFLKVERSSGASEHFRLVRGEMPMEIYLGPGLERAIWNSAGSELCALTLTDAYWISSSPFLIQSTLAGMNASSAAWDKSAAAWCLAIGEHLDIFQWDKSNGRSLRKLSRLTMVEKDKGQGALTAITSAGDGRIAAYRGRRIQFFAGNRAASLDFSILTASEGRFLDVMWDAPGRLLGATFVQTNGSTVLQSWRTSNSFPPKADPLPLAAFSAETMGPANDGACFIVRGRNRGLYLFEPASGAETALDTSASARQAAPMAASSGGAFVAMVVNRNVLRLLRMPRGSQYADLRSPRSTAITAIVWAPSDQQIAAVTDDGYLQLWNLEPWRQWLAANNLD